MTGSNEHDRRVAAMFDGIAPRYDLLNRVLSFGRDLAWRRRAIALAGLGAGDRALDVGAGTGDLSLGLAKAGPSGRVIAVDLAPRMLARGRARAGVSVGLVVASAEALPFADGVFSRVMAGFAVRNFGRLDRGLAEMRRVLQPGGRAVVLELSQPPNPALRAWHLFYLHRLSPVLARLLGSSPEAYRYLPASIEAFLDPERLATALRDAGFERVRYERLTFGVATIHVGET
ncbi:MAG TPA: class I SAM-dependent methyltransferase [Candidatus Limnocylindria bacterium]|nr:class I SAM-dependent methyltransferase [Candidatus Limnocylindria bacterium]